MNERNEFRKTGRAPVSMRRHDIPSPEREEMIGARVSLSIDGVNVNVPLGTTILDAAESAGIRIPTLCHHPDLCIAGLCRICIVEVKGQRTLQAACAYPISQPIDVLTHTQKVRTARRHILDLMLSEHYGECYTCRRNFKCELRRLADEYGVDSFRFGHVEKPKYEKDESSLSVTRDMNKCILCRRCVRTCIDLQEVGALEASGRGEETTISTFMDNSLADVVCINCGQCINRCPTGALTAKDVTDEVWAAIDDPQKYVVIQTAPSPRAAIGESFGLPPGRALTYEMNTALRYAGFDAVFDTNFTADLTIIEEGTELLRRLHAAITGDGNRAALPQFTSCSPGWVKFLEHFYPEMIPNLSTAKSPQQMFGTVIKTYFADKKELDPANIVTVALMPCSAKKFECNRPEFQDSGFKDVDYGITTRELAQMLKETGIDLPKMPKSDFDDPFGTATGSGVIFGATGGVMESALRCVLEIVTGEKVENFYEHANIVPVRGFEGIRYVEMQIPKTGEVPDLLKGQFEDFKWLEGVTLKIGVAHGTANARRVLDNINDGGKFAECHFIEFMACPGGCLGGGGQPIPTTPEIRRARAQAIYAEDTGAEVRKSHENPAIAMIYGEYFTDGPGSELAHKMLHTKYTARGKYIE